MGETAESRGDLMQRLQSSFGTSSSLIPKQQLSTSNRFDLPHLNTNQIRAPFRHFSQNFSPESNSKRPGIPPYHPHFPPIPASRPPVQQVGSQNFSTGGSHSRSLSQPAFFSLDSLPPLSPSPYRESSSTSPSSSVDVSMEDRDMSSQAQTPPAYSRGGRGIRVGESLPPRKAHRRSHSEIPLGFSSGTQSTPPVAPLRAHGSLDRSVSAKENWETAKPIQLVKRESDWDKERNCNSEGMGEMKSEGDAVDDLFSAYMNLENVETLNSGGTSDKQCQENRDDLDSRASGTKTVDSSENEVESSVNECGSNVQLMNLSSSTEMKEGNKRSAGSDDHLNVGASRHCRSISMDSFMGKMNSFGDESPKLLPSPGPQAAQHLRSNSMDGNSTPFSLDFGNGEFSGAELKKIMGNEKLSEIALTDPKRAKRILANRQSAARSKERKMRYISELEHKVQTLQTEATTLSAQLTLLQRDSAGLSTQNNQLKFRIQAMEQQAQLRDALNEALTAEVQRLKVAVGELRESHSSSSLNQQLPMNSQMLHIPHQSMQQLSIYQLQQEQQQNQQQQQPPQNNNAKKHESKQ